MDPRRNTPARDHTQGQQGIAVELGPLEGVSHTTLIGAMAAPLRGLAPVLDRVGGFINRPWV